MVLAFQHAQPHIPKESKQTLLIVISNVHLQHISTQTGHVSRLAQNLQKGIHHELVRVFAKGHAITQTTSTTLTSTYVRRHVPAIIFKTPQVPFTNNVFLLQFQPPQKMSSKLPKRQGQQQKPSHR